MHVQNFIVGYLVCSGAFQPDFILFFVGGNNGNVDNDLIFTMMAAEVNNTLILKSGQHLQIFVDKLFFTDGAAKFFLQMVDDFFEF